MANVVAAVASSMPNRLHRVFRLCMNLRVQGIPVGGEKHNNFGNVHGGWLQTVTNGHRHFTCVERMTPSVHDRICYQIGLVQEDKICELGLQRQTLSQDPCSDPFNTGLTTPFDISSAKKRPLLDPSVKAYTAVSACESTFRIIQSGVIEPEQSQQLQQIRQPLAALEATGPVIDV